LLQQGSHIYFTFYELAAYRQEYCFTKDFCLIFFIGSGVGGSVGVVVEAVVINRMILNVMIHYL